MPVVVHDATEASRAVPAAAGCISADITEFVTTIRALLADPEEAHRRGLIGCRAALSRYGLPRFLHEWDLAFKEAAEMGAGVP
jgi:hypothetical protein